MTIPIAEKNIAGMTEDQTPVLNNILDNIADMAVGIRYTDTLPTTDTVAWGQMTIYDDGAGTKRLYLRTGQDNIGYVVLT